MLNTAPLIKQMVLAGIDPGDAQDLAHLWIAKLAMRGGYIARCKTCDMPLYARLDRRPHEAIIKTRCPEHGTQIAAMIFETPEQIQQELCK